MPVIFDIGGVIYEDVWEGIFLKKHDGVSDLFCLNTENVAKICMDTWNQYSIANANRTSWEVLEKEYWDTILSSLHIPWSVQKCIKYSQNFIIPVKGVADLISNIDTSGTQLGICSNQTAFWFERQLAKSTVLQSIKRRNMVLSFEQGMAKGHDNNAIYRKVVEAFDCNPKDILYIEDRKAHQVSAKAYGFNVIPFNKDELNAVALLKDHLESYGVLFQENNK